MKKHLLFLFLFCSPAVFGSVTAVQGNAGSAAAAAVTVAMPSNVTAGNILVIYTKTGASSGSPFLSLTNTGVACSWSTVGTTGVVNATAIFSMNYCVIPSSGALSVTASWSGATGTYTDLALEEYNSSTGWRPLPLATATADENPVSSTTCATGNTDVSIPPGNFLVAVCGTFSASQTWPATIGSFTNRTAASLSTTGWYDMPVITSGVQSFSTTIVADISFSVIAVFAPLSNQQRGQAVVF